MLSTRLATSLMGASMACTSAGHRFPAFMRTGLMESIDSVCRGYAGPLQVASGSATHGVQIPVVGAHASALLRLGQPRTGPRRHAHGEGGTVVGPGSTQKDRNMVVNRFPGGGVWWMPPPLPVETPVVPARGAGPRRRVRKRGTEVTSPGPRGSPLGKMS
jgi:hypothetical protein